MQPVLPSRDVAVAVGFYVGQLGFELAFADSTRDPRYAGVRRDGVELHLQWHDPEEWSRVERPMLRVAVSDPEALFDEYRGRGIFHERTALRRTSWGTQEFAFYDPDMNGLTFYRDLASPDDLAAPDGLTPADGEGRSGGRAPGDPTSSTPGHTTSGAARHATSGAAEEQGGADT